MADTDHEPSLPQPAPPNPVQIVMEEARERGHQSRTAGAAAGGLIGGAVGSFLGVLPAAGLAAAGALVGAFIGSQIDRMQGTNG